MELDKGRSPFSAREYKETHWTMILANTSSHWYHRIEFAIYAHGSYTNPPAYTSSFGKKEKEPSLIYLVSNSHILEKKISTIGPKSFVSFRLRGELMVALARRRSS